MTNSIIVITKCIIIANQSAQIKQVLNNKKLSMINDIENDINKLKNNIESNDLIISLIIYLECLVSKLYIQINEIIETIILLKQEIINLQFIDSKQFLIALRSVTNRNYFINHIAPEPQNFQTLLDNKIIKRNKLYYFIVSILYKDTWTISKIYLIPHKSGKIFEVTIACNNIAFRINDQYIAVDDNYINRNCTQTSTLRVCKLSQFSHSKIGSKDCLLELLYHIILYHIINMI